MYSYMKVILFLLAGLADVFRGYGDRKSSRLKPASNGPLFCGGAHKNMLQKHRTGIGLSLFQVDRPLIS